MGIRAKIAHDGDDELDNPKGAPARRPLPRERFVVDSRPMGLRRDLSFDKVEEVLDAIDGPARR